MGFDNPVIRFLNKLTDLLVLNLLFLLCSLPVVTMGASLCAMYAVNLRSVRDGDGYVVQRFFKAWKENFRQATSAWLLLLLLVGVLYVDIRFWQAAGAGTVGKVMILFSLAIAMVLWMVFIWVFPVIAKMRDGLRAQMTNAVKMAFAFFIPHTFLCMVLTGGAAYLAVVNVSFLMVMTVFGTALVNWLCCFFIYKGFSRVITEEPIGEEDYLYPVRKEGDDHETSGSGQ